MLRLLAVIVACTLGLVACAGSPELPPNADEQLIEGSEIFRARCASCHGPTGTGGIGRPLTDIEDRLTDAEQRAVVVTGRGTMPRFEGVLTDDEIDAVVRFTREIL